VLVTLKDKFTICVLLYGDHTELADKCLRSIAETIRVEDFQLRVGLNAVSDRTRNWVKSWIHPDCIWESEENIHKYPMMRAMIHEARPVTTEYLMWFDDDSYLEGHKLEEDASTSPWLLHVDSMMSTADMLGSIYVKGWEGNQAEFVKAQPWYAGKEPAGRRLKFATGGWWTIRTELLYKYDYPWPDLDHCGGDTMLGELCHQQDLRLRHFSTGVKINAGHSGVESEAPRRGFTQKPYGSDFVKSAADKLHAATTPLTLPKKSSNIIRL